MGFLLSAPHLINTAEAKGREPHLFRPYNRCVVNLVFAKIYTSNLTSQKHRPSGFVYTISLRMNSFNDLTAFIILCCLSQERILSSTSVTSPSLCFVVLAVHLTCRAPCLAFPAAERSWERE